MAVNDIQRCANALSDIRTTQMISRSAFHCTLSETLSEQNSERTDFSNITRELTDGKETYYC